MVSSLAPYNNTTLAPDSSLESIIPVLLNTKINLVPVVKNQKLLGVLNRHNLIARWLQDPNLSDKKVLEFTTTNSIYLYSDNSVEELSSILKTQTFREIPVLSPNGTYLGLIDSEIVIRHFGKEFIEADTMISELESE